MSGMRWGSGFEMSKAEAAAGNLAPAALTPALSPDGAWQRHAGVCRCHSASAPCAAEPSTTPISWG